METRYTAGDEAEYQQFLLIADKIEADPSLLAIPLANIERWLGRSHHAWRELERWRRRILAAQASAEGMQSLLALIRDDSEEARMEKDFMPCPGILTDDELAQIPWVPRH
jgi:hypothetical protein